MSILWDALLVSAMARELDHRLADRKLRALYLDREVRSLVLFLDGATLVGRLHPEEGHLVPGPARPPLEEATPLKGRVLGARSDPDERVLVLELQSADGERLNLTLELMSNQWNVLLVDVGSRRILRVLRSREAGDRRLVQGAEYAFPSPSEREGKDEPLTLERWLDLLLPLDPGERRRTLLRRVAYTSSLNAPALLGTAVESEDAAAARSALERGHELWLRLRKLDAADPVLLHTERGLQPYPLPLPEFETESCPSLLDAMERSAREEGPGPEAALMPSELLERLGRGVHMARGKVTRLEKELDEAPDPDRLRFLGDLILARFREIPRGRHSVELEDFEGGTVEVELDPSLPPQKNADRYYEEASRAERARQRLPRLIEEATEKARVMERALESARAGELGPERARQLAPEPRSEEAGKGTAERLPYRRYRSSGGLEIRVGRGARSNDELTFHHSSPDDVWLHARHAAGAHVILRWQGEGNPPRRDLLEAAVLAALSSKARSSGTVPVDWTRRKYVRSPRKSAPGVVLPERVQTVFVEPDPAVKKKLRESG